MRRWAWSVASLFGVLLSLTMVAVGHSSAARAEIAVPMVTTSTPAQAHDLQVTAQPPQEQASLGRPDAGTPALGDLAVQRRFVAQIRSAGFAAEGADAAAVDVGHAGIHQFPGITAGKSQFFDGADLGQLSNTDGLTGVVQQNGNLRYVLRGAGDIGVDRTTGLPTDIYTVIRKPDGSVFTMFPGTSPKS